MTTYNSIDLSKRLFFLHLFDYWERTWSPEFIDDVFPKDLVFLRTST